MNETQLGELIVLLMFALFAVLCELFQFGPNTRKPLGMATPLPIRIRWIETRGCMANVEIPRNGVVIEQYLRPADPGLGFYKPEPFWHIRLDCGEVIHFPKVAFIRAEDGVYEHRY